MAKEFEKRYLLFVRPPVEGIEPIVIKQGYLSTDPAKTVRVRITPEKSEVTVKGLRIEGEAPEFNLAAARDDAEGIMALCGQDALTKDRYEVLGHDHKKWEVDLFTGRHTGLMIAELEMNRSDTFLKPTWLNGAVDITTDNRFSNASLVMTDMAVINSWIAEYRTSGTKIKLVL